MAEGTFKHDSLQDRQSVQQYLEVLQQAFASGILRLRVGDELLELEPGEMIEFSLEAKKKGERHKLSLKFTWKDEDKDIHGDESLVMEAE